MKQSIGYVALVVEDYDEAIRFYVGALGFTLVEDTFIEAQDKRWLLVAPPGATGTKLLLARAVGPEQASRVGNQTGGRVFLFLHTDDFWRDYERFKTRGVIFVREPRHESYGTVAVFRDLYGNLWDLIQPGQPLTSSHEARLVIRNCRCDEVETVLQLWRDAEAIPSATDTADDLDRALAENNADVLVAEVDGRLVGSVVGGFDGWRGNIYRLAVHPHFRRRGIARALVVEAERRLKARGAKRITALVAKDHPGAADFWQAVGYALDRRIVRHVRTL
jgi:ribosomal protein S18 acetylase RimI-like enzyme/predicted enzyme related to lactoylglutathione lyase